MSESYETVSLGNDEVSVFSVGEYPPSTIRDSPPPTLILFGPGNPGYIPFYAEFLRALHEKSRLPVWAHGFVGFECEQFSGVTSKHGLLSQVEMVKDLINLYLKGVRLITVDHSTSCFITLKLLGDDDVSRFISEAYFLMPVFTYPDSPDGAVLNWLVTSKPMAVFCEFYANLYLRMPKWCRQMCDTLFFQWLLHYRNIPDLEKWFARGMFARVFYLARDLLGQEFDLNTLIPHADRVHIFTSQCDELRGSWFQELQKRAPNFDTIYHDTIRHSFYVDDSETTADIIIKWVNETAKKKKVSFSQHL